MYDEVTIKQNEMGHLHIWRGRVVPYAVGKHFKANGKEADLYVQADGDIDAILCFLPKDEREDVKAGWTVVTEWVSERHFGE